MGLCRFGLVLSSLLVIGNLSPLNSLKINSKVFGVFLKKKKKGFEIKVGGLPQFLETNWKCFASLLGVLTLFLSFKTLIGFVLFALVGNWSLLILLRC